MWRSRKSNRFQSKYVRLGNRMATRVDSTIALLLSSERPELQGEPKDASRNGYYTYEFGRGCRLLYRPDYVQKIIDFVRVCSHKEVYEP